LGRAGGCDKPKARHTVIHLRRDTHLYSVLLVGLTQLDSRFA